jgi:hypothetical protein
MWLTLAPGLAPKYSHHLSKLNKVTSIISISHDNLIGHDDFHSIDNKTEVYKH